jgi:hypothetical protein
MRYQKKHTPKSTRKEKADFIAANFPDALNKNPRREYFLIVEIKKALFNAKLYSPTYDSASPNIDSAIIRLIEKMQDERKARKNRIDSK